MIMGISIDVLINNTTDTTLKNIAQKVNDGKRITDEECLVLEGSLWQGDVFLKAGDFHVARPGMKHGDLRTDTGALIYIRYAKPLGQYIQL